MHYTHRWWYLWRGEWNHDRTTSASRRIRQRDHGCDKGGAEPLTTTYELTREPLRRVGSHKHPPINPPGRDHLYIFLVLYDVALLYTSFSSFVSKYLSLFLSLFPCSPRNRLLLFSQFPPPLTQQIHVFPWGFPRLNRSPPIIATKSLGNLACRTVDFSRHILLRW